MVRKAIDVLTFVLKHRVKKAYRKRSSNAAYMIYSNDYIVSTLPVLERRQGSNSVAISSLGSPAMHLLILNKKKNKERFVM